MTWELMPKVKTKKKPLQPTVRLAMRLIVLCYQHFDLMARRPIELSYIGYSTAFKGAIQKGDLAEALPLWIWRIISVRSRDGGEKEKSPYWPIAKAQATRFIEENKSVIAEEELST